MLPAVEVDAAARGRFETPVIDGMSPSASVSLARSWAVTIVAGVSSVTETVSSPASGASFWQVTSTVTLALSLPPLPSLMS